jgi:hypothetical protein
VCSCADCEGASTSSSRRKARTGAAVARYPDCRLLNQPSSILNLRPNTPFRLATIPAGFSLAKIQVETPKIGLDRAKIDLEKSKIDLERVKSDPDITKIHFEGARVRTETLQIRSKRLRFHPEPEQILSELPKIDFETPKIGRHAANLGGVDEKCRHSQD